MIKPILPVITDWWQHEFNEAAHLSYVHAVYGSHHLRHEIADTGSENDHSKNQNTLRSEDQVLFHVLVSEFKNEYNAVLSNIQFDILKFLKLSSVVITRDGPPPEFT